MSKSSYVTEDNPEFNISIIDCDAIKLEALSYEYYVFKIALSLSNQLVDIHALTENDLEQIQLFLLKLMEVNADILTSEVPNSIILGSKRKLIINSINHIAKVLSVDPTTVAKLKLLGVL